MKVIMNIRTVASLTLLCLVAVAVFSVVSLYAEQTDGEVSEGYWVHYKTVVVKTAKDCSEEGQSSLYNISENSSIAEHRGKGYFQRNRITWNMPETIVPGRKVSFSGNITMKLEGDAVNNPFPPSAAVRMDFFHDIGSSDIRTTAFSYGGVVDPSIRVPVINNTDGSPAYRLFGLMCPGDCDKSGNGYNENFEFSKSFFDSSYRTSGYAAIMVSDISVGSVIYVYKWERGSPSAIVFSGKVDLLASTGTAAVLSVLMVLMEAASSAVSSFSASAPAVLQSGAAATSGGPVPVADNNADAELARRREEERLRQWEEQKKRNDAIEQAERQRVIDARMEAAAGRSVADALSDEEKKKLIIKKAIMKNMQAAYEVKGQSDASASLYDAAANTASTVLNLANYGVDLTEGAIKAVASVTNNKILEGQASLIKNSYLMMREFLPEAVQAVHDPLNAADNLIRGTVKGVREMFFNWASGEAVGKLDSLSGGGLGNIAEPSVANTFTKGSAAISNAFFGKTSGDIVTGARNVLAGTLESGFDVMKNAENAKQTDSFTTTACKAVMGFLKW